jgi:hypothetical protein
MKKLLFFLLISNSFSAQVDTIITNEGHVIACKILKEKEESLKYRVVGEWDQWIKISDVNRFINYDEKVTRPGTPRPVQFQADTGHSLEAEVMRNRQIINSIQYYMRSCHQQYNNGLILMGGGLGISLLGSLAEGDKREVIIGMGAGIMIVGYINLLASHRWLKKAGNATGRATVR